MKTVDLEWALELAGFLFSWLPSKIPEEMRMGGKSMQSKNSSDSDLPCITGSQGIFDVPGGELGDFASVTSFMLLIKALKNYYYNFICLEIESRLGFSWAFCYTIEYQPLWTFWATYFFVLMGFDGFCGCYYMLVTSALHHPVQVSTSKKNVLRYYPKFPSL